MTVAVDMTAMGDMIVADIILYKFISSILNVNTLDYDLEYKNQKINKRKKQ